jgi:hypothetical protein
MFDIADASDTSNLGTSVLITRRGRWRVHVEGTRSGRYLNKNSAKAISHAYRMLEHARTFPQRRAAV